MLAAITIAGLLAAATAGTAAAAPKPKPAKKAAKVIRDIRLFISADTNIQDLWQKTLIPAFETRYPQYRVDVTFDLHGVHDAQTTAKVTAATVLHKDPGIDLIDGGFTVQLGTSGLLAPETVKTMPNLKLVSPSVLKAGRGGIPYRGSSVLLAYNATTVPTPPKTLDDLLAWIKANPGKFTYNAPAGGGAGYAFVQTVVDKYVSDATRQKMTTDVVPELEGEWTQGLSTLRGLNPYTYGKNGTYPANNTATLSLLASGQVDMGTVWSDQFTTARRTGAMPANIKVTQISNPSLTGGASYLGIPRAATNIKGAQVLANWVLTPQAQNLIMGGTLNGYPVIPLKLLDPTLADNFANADIANLRPTYTSAMANDLKNAWASSVPGK